MPLYNQPTASTPGVAYYGKTTVDFGAFPGSVVATTNVIGQLDILSSSVIHAWITSSSTADHSEDEHIIEELNVRIGNVISGNGFTINVIASLQSYGLWNVAWRWE